MEAAFVDIGTPKNAVLYWGDVSYDRDDVERQAGADRIEHLLRPGQTIVCQVTKNPIGLKGARLTQEVSIPGRFVVLVPESATYGISRRLDDSERRRLRRILDDVRPEGHGLIVRTAAAGASAEDLRRDVEMLVGRWREIDERTRKLPAPALLYSEPHMAVRIIREELTDEHRSVLIGELFGDDPHRHVRFGVQECRRGELSGPLIDLPPAPDKHLDVSTQVLGTRPGRGSAHDEAVALRTHVVEDPPQPAALAVVETPRDPIGCRLGHQHDEATRDRHLLGQTGPLQPDRVLGDLADDRLARPEQVLDPIGTCLALDVVAVVGNVTPVEDRVLRCADVDKGRLHPGKHVLHSPAVDVADNLVRVVLRRATKCSMSARPSSTAMWVASCSTWTHMR